MKMTMHIDEDVLDEVMKLTGCSSKTAAVEKALSEMVRRSRLSHLLKEGMGMTAAEIKDSFDFATYDAMNTSAPIVSKPVKYKAAPKGRKSSS